MGGDERERGKNGASGQNEDRKSPLSSGAQGAPSDAPDDATVEMGMPPKIADLAAACVRFTAQRYRVPLDFGPDTLPLVDQYVRDARRELAERPESLPIVVGCVGAYLGEVIRLAHGGVWRAEGDESTWRVLMTSVFLSFNPLGMVREALTLEEAEGWGAHLELDDGEREAVEARLRALPDVAEEDYGLPTTRFEVVQVAVEALRERMRANGLADVTFDGDDYK